MYLKENKLVRGTPIYIYILYSITPHEDHDKKN